MPRKFRERPALRGFPRKYTFVSKQEVDHYFSNPDGIQCLLCGRIYRTLNGHLQVVHGTSHEEYRRRYGLPWRRGLVSRKVSNRLTAILTERIRNGSFKPEPDNRAAVARIRAGGRRRDQPFVILAKAEMGKQQSKQNLRYSRKDFENVLSAMQKRKATLREACMDRKLPSEPTVLRYADLNPSFRREMLETWRLHRNSHPV
jgi:hypothetical protein